MCSTFDLKFAMEYIGDSDIRRAREYVQVRPDHFKEAASVMDRVTLGEPGLELVGTGGPTELPRQDSNLRPVDTKRARPRARAQKNRGLASRKSRGNVRNAPESHPPNRPRTVPRETKRDE